jgi:apolipoprotein N-acyltransferase
MFGVLLVGHCLQCVAFATPPVPVIAVIGFGPPLALLRFGAIRAGEIARRRLGEGAGILAYIASTVLLDWMGYGVTELGAWMATSNSQVESLAFLQLASIAGLAGLNAMMAWTGAALASLLGAPRAGARAWHAIAVAIALTIALAWGTLRLEQPWPGRSVAAGEPCSREGRAASRSPMRAAALPCPAPRSLHAAAADVR